MKGEWSLRYYGKLTGRLEQLHQPIAALQTEARREQFASPASDLETEVAQCGTQVVLDGDGLRLKQLAMGQQHPKLLAA
jgi:hypothetical protein